MANQMPLAFERRREQDPVFQAIRTEKIKTGQKMSSTIVKEYAILIIHNGSEYEIQYTEAGASTERVGSLLRFEKR
mgnify:CR=1 FL=1